VFAASRDLADDVFIPSPAPIRVRNLRDNLVSYTRALVPSI